MRLHGQDYETARVRGVGATRVPLPRGGPADPAYYAAGHFAHHKKFGTPEDGSFTSYVPRRRLLLALLPMAPLFSASDYFPWRPQERTRSRLLASVAHVTRVPVEKLDPRARLRDLGMDSLMALEIAAELERALGVKVPAMAVTNGPPIDELAKLVLAQLVLAHAARAGGDVTMRDAARPLPPSPSLQVASRAA